MATGRPSIVPAETAIHHNFIVSDYDANGGMIDNDDGSSFYDEYQNFGVYGGAKFGNIDGVPCGLTNRGCSARPRQTWVNN